jgi:hypothetical protein
MPVFSIVIVCAAHVIGCPIDGAVYSHIEAVSDQHCVDLVEYIIRHNDHLNPRLFVISCSKEGT